MLLSSGINGLQGVGLGIPQLSPKIDIEILTSDFDQGCKMVYFQTKNPNLGKIWRVNRRCLDIFSTWYILQSFGMSYGHLVYFLVIWYVFPVFVCSSKKNLSTQTSTFDCCKSAQIGDTLTGLSAAGFGDHRHVHLVEGQLGAVRHEVEGVVHRVGVTL
jgi:hypothetical protein